VLKKLGKQGDFKDNVLKINIPPERLEGHHRRHCDADTVRLRRMAGDD
jgi:hypothetical protein